MTEAETWLRYRILEKCQRKHLTSAECGYVTALIDVWREALKLADDPLLVRALKHIMHYKMED